MHTSRQRFWRFSPIGLLIVVLLAGKTAAHASQPVALQAGPIRLKFADGELRYLYIGNKEIVRRVYFAVRDSTWNTAMPAFTRVNIQRQPTGFTIDLDATCHTSLADYSWTGHIVGTTAGQITFTAQGKANSNFQSQRIGLCVLYGAGSLGGQPFQTISPAGTTTSGMFPLLVSPTLVAGNFQTLRYTTETGLQVAGSITGAYFDMEDQRNYGDSSYKAYATLPYNYPNITKGDTKTETFTLQVKNVPAEPPPSANVYLVLGNRLAATVARKIPLNTTIQPIDFVSINTNRSGNTGARALTWGFNPSVHLPDDDTFMDNVSTIVDQAKTARTFAPHAALHITPIRPDYTPQTPQAAPRSGEIIGAAWSAALLKYMSLAGLTDISFEEGTGFAEAIQNAIALHTGQHLYDITAVCYGHPPVDGLAVQDNGQPVLWLTNVTANPQAVAVRHLPVNTRCELQRYTADTDLSTGPPVEGATTHSDVLYLILSAYEVCEIHFPKN